MKLKNRNYGLDVLRSMAILIVIFAHSSTLYNPFIQIPIIRYGFGKILAVSQILGYLSIDLFFVLSGFLITNIILNEFPIQFSVKDIKLFWIRRWLRTLPNYYLILLLNGIIFCVVLQKYIFDFRYLFFAQNIYKPQPNFFREAWSLAIEEWFYLLFPVMILIVNLIYKNIKKSILVAISLMLGSSFIFKYIFLDFIVLDYDELVRKIVIFRFDSIAIGAFCAWIFTFKNELFFRYKNVLMTIGLLSICILIILFYQIYENNYALYLQNHYINILVNYCFSVCCSISFAISFPFVYNYNSKKYFQSFFTLTSKLSYSMYLIHLPVYLILYYYPKRFPDNPINSIVYILIYFVIIYAISYFLYHNFEKYFLKYRDINFPNN